MAMKVLVYHLHGEGIRVEVKKFVKYSMNYCWHDKTINNYVVMVF